MRKFLALRLARVAAIGGAAAILAAASSAAETTFSVDFQGPMSGGATGPGLGIPEFFFGVPVDEGQILTPALPGPPGPNPPFFGAPPPPGMMVDALPGSPFGIAPGGLGIIPGVFGGLEIDALSYGRDRGLTLVFSVDEFACGDLSVPPLFPDVQSEGSAAAAEAAADVFMYLGPVVVTPLPAPAPGLGPGNTDVADGDGIGPWGLPGFGLIEPNPPTPVLLPDPGDNLDAVDYDTGMQDVFGPIYFSLDSLFPDPLEISPPAQSGTAIGNGAVGGDVLVSFAGGVPAIFIPAPMLGLDLINGPDSDNLDALALYENGDGAFISPPDVILFSVSRGSSVIGAPDSLNGLPIEEGDVLTLPVPGGLSPFPSIYIPAEALGLATLRSQTIGPFPFGDDLDALDLPGCRLPGCIDAVADRDMDGDCDVDSTDLALLLGNFGTTIGATNAMGDCDGDGDVDSTDLAYLLSAFGTNCY